jgi:hypothetical protein
MAHGAMSPTNLSFEKTEKNRNLSAVVGKLTAEVRYLSSKNRESQFKVVVSNVVVLKCR